MRLQRALDLTANDTVTVEVNSLDNDVTLTTVDVTDAGANDVGSITVTAAGDAEITTLTLDTGDASVVSVTGGANATLGATNNIVRVR